MSAILPERHYYELMFLKEHVLSVLDVFFMDV